MREPRYKIRRESYARQRLAGRFNPALEIHILKKDRTIILPIAAGSSDRIIVREERREYFVCSINRSLGYCGIEIFTADYAGSYFLFGELFLQSDFELREILGKQELQLSDATILRRLANYLGECNA